MLGAVFKIHQAQERLDSVNSSEAETVSEASELLSDAIEKMSDRYRIEDELCLPISLRHLRAYVRIELTACPRTKSSPGCRRLGVMLELRPEIN